MENPDETYTISAELPMGSRVILVSSDKSRQSGHLSSQETRHFTVTLDPGSAIPGVGDQFRIYIFSRTGVFSFPSQITKTLDLDVCLQHSDEIRRFQRRNFKRKEAAIPVLVKTARSEQTYLSSELVDVGGGGAALMNPEKQFTKDDMVLMTFTFSGERFSVIAKVVRTSQGGEVLHVRFESVNETARERLISTLY